MIYRYQTRAMACLLVLLSLMSSSNVTANQGGFSATDSALDAGLIVFDPNDTSAIAGLWDLSGSKPSGSEALYLQISERGSLSVVDRRAGDARCDNVQSYRLVRQGSIRYQLVDLDGSPGRVFEANALSRRLTLFDSSIGPAGTYPALIGVDPVFNACDPSAALKVDLEEIGMDTRAIAGLYDASESEDFNGAAFRVHLQVTNDGVLALLGYSEPELSTDDVCFNVLSHLIYDEGFGHYRVSSPDSGTANVTIVVDENGLTLNSKWTAPRVSVADTSLLPCAG